MCTEICSVGGLAAARDSAVELLRVGGNPLCGAEGWREEVRAAIPSLLELDGEGESQPRQLAI